MSTRRVAVAMMSTRRVAVAMMSTREPDVIGALSLVVSVKNKPTLIIENC